MRLHDVLRPDTHLELTLVAGPWDARPVQRVRVAGDPADVRSGRRGELTVLTRRASRLGAGRAALLSLLEAAGERELAALALYGLATASPVAIDAVYRARVALLSIAPDREPAELAHAIEDVLRNDPDAVLRRLLAARAAIEHAEPAGAEAVLVAASGALEAELRLRPSGTDGPSAPVVANGRRDAVVWADRDDAATRIGCQLAADAIVRARSGRVHTPDPIAGHVRAVAVEAVHGERDGEVVLLEAFRLTGGSGWRVSRHGERAVVVGESEAAARLLDRIRQRLPGVDLLCGVSDEHHSGRADTAIAEARAALERARVAQAVNLAVPFGGTQPGGLAAEVAGSEGGRAAAAALLAPLERLGERRAEQAVRTLQVYLDSWGSLARSGRTLHLHPNAVAHRMKRIRTALPHDLDDPEQRLALQLACRGWLAARSRHPAARSTG